MLSNGQTYFKNLEVLTPVIFDHFSTLFVKRVTANTQAHLGLCQTSPMELFAKIDTVEGNVDYIGKTFRHRYLTGSQILA